MNKTAFIIPDWQDKVTSSAYVNVASAFKNAGYDILGQDFPWTSGSVKGWATQLSNEIEQSPTPPVVCAVGLGCMIALVAAAQTPIDHLILCSPKGYFKEYVTHPQFISQRWMGDNRLEEFANLSAAETLANAHIKKGTIIFDQGEVIGKPTHSLWIDDLISTTKWDVIKLPRQMYGVKSPTYQRAMVELAKTGSFTIITPKIIK